MTIHVLGLANEVLRLSDSRHSEIITKENDTFTLAEGEREFTVEQTAAAPTKPRGGWAIYLLGQIVTALIRALVIRKPIYERCNPILLTAKVQIKPCRYDFCTLFYVAGGYNEDTHTYYPPRLEGEEQLSIEAVGYSLDEANVTRAVREETDNKVGYTVWLIVLPIVLFITALLWETPPLSAIALFVLVLDTAVCIGLQLHSRKVKADLQKKVGDTLHYLNLGLK